MQAGNYQRVKSSGAPEMFRPHFVNLGSLTNQDRLHHAVGIFVARIKLVDPAQGGAPEVEDRFPEERTATVRQPLDRGAWTDRSRPINLPARRIIHKIERARVVEIA